jgi:hypothetical protein
MTEADMEAQAFAPFSGKKEKAQYIGPASCRCQVSILRAAIQERERREVMSDVVQYTNGRSRRQRIDGRTRVAKTAKRWDQRKRDLYVKILTEIPPASNGRQHSEWQKQEAMHAAWLITRRERMEEDAAAIGENMNSETYASLSEHRARSFDRLGAK